MPGLLICGSRDASDALLLRAKRIVQATVNYDEWFPSILGAFIVVGDARGIDDAVATACKELKLPYRCFGVTPKPRNSASPDKYTDVWQKPCESKHDWSQAFLFRDRYMVDLDGVEMVIALWNGVSRGTKYTWGYAADKGKRVRLIR